MALCERSRKGVRRFEEGMCKTDATFISSGPPSLLSIVHWQEDIHLPTATVEEALLFSSHLR